MGVSAYRRIGVLANGIQEIELQTPNSKLRTPPEGRKVIDESSREGRVPPV
jgi:hypothetical protein